MKRKKRILFLGAFQAPGGEEEVILYLYKNMPSEDYEAYLCGPARAQFFEKHGVPKETFLDLDMKGSKDIKSLIRLVRYIKRYEIDIIHCHGTRGGLYGRLASFLSSRKPLCIWTLHLFIHDDLFTISRLRKTVYTKVESFLSRRFTDQIVTVSDDLKVKYETLFHLNKVRTIHNGIDVDKFYAIKPPAAADRITFGFVSRLSRQKGIPYLLQAMHELVHKRSMPKEIRLLVAGTGEEEERLKQMVRELDLQEHVEFLGFRRDIPELLRQIDVMVLPSLFEGFPMIILESLCADTPVIASRVNGIPEAIEHNVNGRLVEAGSVPELVESMSYYIEHPEAIRLHGSAGQHRVIESYTLGTMLEKHVALYDSMLGEGAEGTCYA